MAAPPSDAGGFLPPGLLSPAPSSATTTTTTTAFSAALPSTRANPLRPGGAKEAALVRHLDAEVLRINRRFAKRGRGEGGGGGREGYADFKEAGADIERVVDVVWVSGTPSLQIPYLMSLALLTSTALAGLPPSPRAAFRLLGKLDAALASLLAGRDVETGARLPGFEGGRGVSGTERVRIKSLVERTRVVAVEALAGAEGDEEGEEGGEEETDGEGGREGDVEDADEISWEMMIAKVYDQTIVELGDTIGGMPIGIVTDE